jgi:hypothetical protein
LYQLIRTIRRRYANARRAARKPAVRSDPPLVAAGIALVAGVAVFLLATTVFGYHSSNHDEGVYLTQAAMLLDGQLELHAGDLVGAFRPWFFVEDGGRLYPKYTPVPAAMYAVSMALFGEPRVTLAAVAAGNAALVYALGRMLVDRRTGAVAAGFFAASPLALVTTSVFLPYAPTTLLNLLFAVGYLYGIREGSTVAAGVAGVAIGLAFFARPFTAVLFAIPFVCHALYRVGTAIRRAGLLPLPGPVRRQVLTAFFGLCFVGVTLAYNARLTGSPLVFPYEAFAPLDGPGFGRRRILGHSIVYSPEVALEANGYVLRYFSTRWFTAGILGTALSVAGLAFSARRWYRGGAVPGSSVDRDSRFQRTAGVLIAGLFVTVPVGNLLFWGNFNILATPSDPTDGIVSQFGPFYHFDLLVPFSLFAAVGVFACWRFLRAFGSRLETRWSPRAGKAFLVVALLASVLLVGAVNVTAVSAPLERNAAHEAKHEAAYEPIERTSFEDALVFIPTPYGDWQNHPFQYLRNDPGFDGDVVYALDRDPPDDFAVLDAYPDRTHYRYTYRGEWTSDPNRHVVPKLEPLEIRRGPTLEGETTVGVPERVDRASVRLEADADTYAGYTVADPDGSITANWTLDGDTARLVEGDTEPIPLEETDTVTLLVTLAQADGSTLTYRQETTVRTNDGGVEAVWPPERYVCPLVTDCGTEGTYLPDDPDAHFDGVWFETRMRNTER